jgi:hypothetical protein
VKDALIAHTEGGLMYQMRPCGTGVVDFHGVLPVVAAANPTIHLSIENDESLEDRPRPRSRMRIEIDNPDFLAGHPDLTEEEKVAYLDMVAAYEQRIANGEVPSFDEYAAQPYGYAETVKYIQDSAAHLRAVCEAHGLPLGPASTGVAV